MASRRYTIFAYYAGNSGWTMETTNKEAVSSQEAVKSYFLFTGSNPKSVICFPSAEGMKYLPPSAPEWSASNL